MNFEFPEIISSGIFDTKKSRPGISSTPPRTIYYYELEYYLEDGGICVINDVSYDIKKGSILLVKPGDTRYAHLPYVCRFIHFNAHDEKLSALLKDIKPFSYASDRKKTEDFFTVASAFFYSKNIIDNMAASANLMLLLQSLSLESPQSTSIVYDAQKFIESNYHINLSTEDIASECNVSVSYLHQVFKKRLHTTPGDYLTACRISAACNMLINTTLSLIEISFSCGFNSQSYFSYCFKQHTGVSPMDYRKSHREI